MIDRARWRIRAVHALVLISGALAPVAARAADQPAAAAAPPLVERVQVITTRAPEPVETTPASVTVITRDDLIRRGAYDLRSALLIAAGIDIAPGGDGGPAGSVPEFWGLREFDAFLLAVDGFPWGGAFNPSLVTLDLNDVERIEILRGAAPVSYGATSFVGVINVVHGEPGSGGTTLRTAAGNYDTGSVAWSSPLPAWGEIKSSLQADVSHQGFSDDRTDFARGHVRWQNSRKMEHGTLRFGVDSLFLRQDPGSPHPRVGTSLTTQVPVDANHNMTGARVDENRHTLNAGYDRKLETGSWSNSVTVSRSRQEVLRGFLTDVTLVAPNAHGFRESIPTVDAFFDSHMAFHPDPKVEVVAGFDHLHGSGRADGGDFDYFVDLEGDAPPSGSSLSNEAAVTIRDRREFSGLYGQVVWNPKERWHFELGARLNRTAEFRKTDTLDFVSSIRVKSDDRRNVMRGGGFAGMTWTAWRKGANALHLYTNYRNTYKPAVIDFGLDADPEILAPETAESYEAGLKSGLMGGRLAVELSAFQMDFENLVLSQVVGGVPALVNGGTQRFRGIEVSTVVRPWPVFEWRTVYSLHDARFRDYVTEFGGVPTQLAGKRLEMSARYMAATEFVVGRAEGWRGNVRSNWIGSRFLNKRNTALAPDYITWSAGIGYALGNVELRVDGTNLNDQRPPVAESELGDAQYYLMPARRVEVSARWLLGGSPR